jgi:hypothetical protein
VILFTERRLVGQGTRRGSCFPMWLDLTEAWLQQVQRAVGRLLTRRALFFIKDIPTKTGSAITADS